MQEQRASEFKLNAVLASVLHTASKAIQPTQNRLYRIAPVLGEENAAQENSFGHRVNTRAAPGKPSPYEPVAPALYIC